MLFFVLALAQVAFGTDPAVATGCCASADDFVTLTASCTLAGTIPTCADVKLDGTESSFVDTDGVCAYTGGDVTETNCGDTTAKDGADADVTGTYAVVTPACSVTPANDDTCTTKDGANDWTMTGKFAAAGCCGAVTDETTAKVLGSCMCADGELDKYKMLTNTAGDTMTCGKLEADIAEGKCNENKAKYADQCCTTGDMAAGVDKNIAATKRMIVTQYFSGDACAEDAVFYEEGELVDTACTAVDGTTDYTQVSTTEACDTMTTKTYTDDACTTAKDGAEDQADTPAVDATCTDDADTGLKTQQMLLCEAVTTTTQEPQTTAGDSTAMLSALLVMIAAVLKY